LIVRLFTDVISAAEITQRSRRWEGNWLLGYLTNIFQLHTLHSVG